MPVGHRRRRRLGLGDVDAGRACCGGSRRAPPGHAPIDVGAGVDLRRLRRGRGVDGQLRRRHVSPGRPAHERGHARRCRSARCRRWRPAPARPGSAPRARRATGTLPASACGELVSGGAEPDVLIASDLPLQGADGRVRARWRDAIRAVLTEHGFRAGRYIVGYRSCDDSTRADRQLRAAPLRRERERVRQRRAARGGDRPATTRSAPQVEIPILNRAPGGPLADDQPDEHRRRAHARAAPPPDGYRGDARGLSTPSAPATTSG